MCQQEHRSSWVSLHPPHPHPPSLQMDGGMSRLPLRCPAGSPVVAPSPAGPDPGPRSAAPLSPSPPTSPQLASPSLAPAAALDEEGHPTAPRGNSGGRTEESTVLRDPTALRDGRGLRSVCLPFSPSTDLLHSDLLGETPRGCSSEGLGWSPCCDPRALPSSRRRSKGRSLGTPGTCSGRRRFQSCSHRR